MSEVGREHPYSCGPWRRSAAAWVCYARTIVKASAWRTKADPWCV